MTTSIDSAAAGLTPRHHGPVFECNGAEMRAQYRHLATVVTISGAIDVENVDQISAFSRRFILSDKPFVLDLCGVDRFTPQGVGFLRHVDEECRIAGLEWALVASPVVSGVLRILNDDNTFPAVASVHAALHEFADEISARRRLLLPLLGKTA